MNLKTRLLTTALAGFFFGMPAAHATDYPATSPEAQKLIEPYFANTRTCKGMSPAGNLVFECHTWLNKDGTFLRFSWDGRPDAGPLAGVTGVEGTWFVRKEGDAWQFCRAFGTAKPSCEDEPQRKVGAKWSKYHDTGAMKGITEYFEIVAGRK